MARKMLMSAPRPVNEDVLLRSIDLGPTLSWKHAQEQLTMARPYRVVIADDEKSVATGLQNQLESLGYDVVAVVNDGQRAVELCRRIVPDAVFLDIEMPGLDGLSAARQIVE